MDKGEGIFVEECEHIAEVQWFRMGKMGGEREED